MWLLTHPIQSHSPLFLVGLWLVSYSYSEPYCNTVVFYFTNILIVIVSTTNLKSKLWKDLISGVYVFPFRHLLFSTLSFGMYSISIGKYKDLWNINTKIMTNCLSPNWFHVHNIWYNWYRKCFSPHSAS